MKKKILSFSVGGAAVLVLLGGVYWYHHPTHYKYNDRFIVGNTEENITERYGAFSKTAMDESGETVFGAYMVKDDSAELVMSYDDSIWYEICFEDGIAVTVELQKGQRGG